MSKADVIEVQAVVAFVKNVARHIMSKQPNQRLMAFVISAVVNSFNAQMIMKKL